MDNPSTPLLLATTGRKVEISRNNFPDDFIFGAASSAYQFEGAAKEGGKGLCAWDVFLDDYPAKTDDGQNGLVAVNTYHVFKEDVKIMKRMGLQAYRLSISWSRVLPSGKLCGGVNQEGIKYYNELIDELLANDIEPWVTIFQFDLPQSLQEAYGGFLSPQIIHDYVDYAEVCFCEFGDRVKHWITFNEPWSYSVCGYVEGTFPPGHGVPTPVLARSNLPIHRGGLQSLSSIDATITGSGLEPYLVSHHQILAHAAAVDLYRKHFQVTDDRKIGIILCCSWSIPYEEDDEEDVEAQHRALDFILGWFMQPLTTGEYPASMRQRVKDLPTFYEKEKPLVKGSYDFVGINYYTSSWVKPANDEGPSPNYLTDMDVQNIYVKNGHTIGPKGSSSWLYSYPPGLRDLLNYVNDTYHPPVIYVTENGIDEANDPKKTTPSCCSDLERIAYHKKHLQQLKLAIDKDHINVKGYFIWSLLDNFEWASGYTCRFGLVFVDYKNHLARSLKKSAIWYMHFLQNKNFRVAAKRSIQQNDEAESSAKKLKN